MKKIYALTIACLLIYPLFFYSCSDDKENEPETEISKDQLPEKALTFLKKYFKDYEILKVEKEMAGETVIYEVDLQDGYEVVFNSEGDWQQVDAPYGKTIPTGFIPEPIMQTLNYQYNGYGVAEINTMGQNYHIVLSNNQGGDSIELIFNQSGEIISIGGN